MFLFELVTQYLAQNKIMAFEGFETLSEISSHLTAFAGIRRWQVVNTAARNKHAQSRKPSYEYTDRIVVPVYLLPIVPNSVPQTLSKGQLLTARCLS
jgi:hypothetical protein